MNKVIEQNGKHYSKCNVHLLQTKQDNSEGFYLSTANDSCMKGELEYCNFPIGRFTHRKIKHHLYITSKEKPQINDWVLCAGADGEGPIKIIKYTGEELGIAKIIATTDKRLLVTVHGNGSIVTPEYLPQPSKQFIQKYITEYNKNNIITECLVEFDKVKTGEDSECICGEAHPFYKPLDGPCFTCGSSKLIYKDIFSYNTRIDSHNCITIKPIKDTYTREEVIALLAAREKDINEGGGYTHEYWIEKNL